MGLVLTLFLISTNCYNSLIAPSDRGVSFIEIWMIGTLFPVLLTLFQFGLILANDKFFDKTTNATKWDAITLIIVLLFHLVFQTTFWIIVSAYF